jgi:MFS transporter, SP family, general alpha glucoside:H+ symporter
MLLSRSSHGEFSRHVSLRSRHIRRFTSLLPLFLSNIRLYMSLVTITYASEVCPVPLRGYLTTYVNFCWGLGQLIGIGVIKSQLGRTDEWAYRIPYALQWMWPVPLLVGIALAPESPWWLVRKGRLDDAKRSLLRLTSKNRETGFNADETIAMMVHTTALEEHVSFFFFQQR